MGSKDRQGTRGTGGLAQRRPPPLDVDHEAGARVDEGQRVGAAFEIGNRQLIGLGRIGMVDALRHPPAPGLLARNRRGAFRLRHPGEVDPHDYLSALRSFLNRRNGSGLLLGEVKS